MVLLITSKRPKRRFDRLHELSREYQRGHVRLRGVGTIPICRKRGELLWWPEAAITRTALGTAQSKTDSNIFITGLSGQLTVGATLILAGAGDATFTGSVRLLDASLAELGTFTNRVEANNSGNVVTAIWELPNLSASQVTNADHVIFSGAFAKAGALLMLAGVSASPFDKSSTGINSSLAATSGATATTTQADEILIGAIGWEGPVEDQDGTWQNSFTPGQQAGTTGAGAASNITVDEGYRIVSATGAYTAALTRTLNSRDWAAAIATYKAASAAVRIEPYLRSFTPIARSANY